LMKLNKNMVGLYDSLGNPKIHVIAADLEAIIEENSVCESGEKEINTSGNGENEENNRRISICEMKQSIEKTLEEIKNRNMKKEEKCEKKKEALHEKEEKKNNSEEIKKNISFSKNKPKFDLKLPGKINIENKNHKKEEINKKNDEKDQKNNDPKEEEKSAKNKSNFKILLESKINSLGNLLEELKETKTKIKKEDPILKKEPPNLILNEINLSSTVTVPLEKGNCEKPQLVILETNQKIEEEIIKETKEESRNNQISDMNPKIIKHHYSCSESKPGVVKTVEEKKAEDILKSLKEFAQQKQEKLFAEVKRTKNCPEREHHRFFEVP